MQKILALFLSPWIILLSSAINLFLLNQDSLDHNTRVLELFLAMTVLGVLAGYGILYDSRKNNHYLMAPWLFFLAGPTFILWNTLTGILPAGSGDGVITALFFIAWLGLGFALKRVDWSRLTPFFALFAVLVITSDIIRLGLGIDTDTSKVLYDSQPDIGMIEQREWAAESDALPNIYHVVLDDYQSDIFEFLLDEKLRSELGGFINFKNNTSLFDKTRLAIPTVFLSRAPRADMSIDELKNSAFNANQSLLGTVLDYHYQTSAYLHQELDFSSNLFQQVHYHQEFRADHPWSNRAFIWLWIYSYWPGFISDYWLDQGIIDQLKSGNLSPDGYPVISLDGFRYFLSREQFETGRGRYVFIHLIIPHPPYRLTENCEVKYASSARAQHVCANHLIVLLVRELKRLNRFDDSMIIIHADHGSSQQIRGNSLYKNSAANMSAEHYYSRTKALLLFKPFGRSADHQYLVDETRTTLLDIIPTIAASLGKTDLSVFEGIPLTTRDRPQRPRYFYVHDGLKFHRFRIDDDKLTDEGPLE